VRGARSQGLIEMLNREVYCFRLLAINGNRGTTSGIVSSSHGAFRCDYLLEFFIFKQSKIDCCEPTWTQPGASLDYGPIAGLSYVNQPVETGLQRGGR
jgi:hypothetical protein